MLDFFYSLKDPFNQIFFIFFGIMYVSVLYFIFRKAFTLVTPKRIKKEKEKEERDAFDLLKKGYEQHTLNEKAIRRIYNKLSSNLDNLYDYTFVKFLDEFLIYIRNEDTDGNLTNKIEELVNPILDKEKEEKPYANINEGERRILLAIEESASQNEVTSLKRHLLDLSVLIENNQKEKNKAEATNKWTIPLSICGVIFTLIFGIYGFFGSSLSRKDISNISDELNERIVSSVDSINKQIITNTNYTDSVELKKNK